MNTDIIKQIITDLLEKMGFQGKVEIDAADQNNLVANIQTEEAGFLIGQAGANLQALQHLSRVLVSKKLAQPVQFIVDVNHYRQHRIELLKELANNIANQALTEQAPQALQPMSAYERRVVHLALAENPQIETESIGQEPSRKVMIKPKL